MYGIFVVMTLRSLFVDLNSYFASCEQQERPALRGKPVAVAAVDAESTCCVAASGEAKRLGVKTGTPIHLARRMVPGLAVVIADTERYVTYHRRLIEAIDTVLPIWKVRSIDEFECRLMGDEREPDRAAELAGQIKRAVRRRVGVCLTSSIGIAPNRVLAKLGSDMMKPDGLVIIQQHQLPGRLHGLEMQAFAGIGPRIDARLRRFGIRGVADLCARSESELVEAWGSIVGAQWWRWLRGLEVHEPPTIRRTIGHEHVLAPTLRNEADARAVMVKLIHKAAARARAHALLAGAVRVSALSLDGSWWEADGRCEPPTFDTLELVRRAGELWSARASDPLMRGRPIKIAVRLSELEPAASATLPLFPGPRPTPALSEAIDKVNAKFGRGSIRTLSATAADHAAPTRIAFGHIPSMDPRQ